MFLLVLLTRPSLVFILGSALMLALDLALGLGQQVPDVGHPEVLRHLQPAA